MKHLQILGLAGLATVVLMASAVAAPAAVLTSPAGSTYTGTLKAENEVTVYIEDLSLFDECTSKFELAVESHGGEAPVKGSFGSFSVSECLNKTTITFLKRGSLEIQTHPTSGEKSGRLTWTGAEITVVSHLPAFGTFDCLYGIDVANSAGTLTGSLDNSGKTATTHTVVAWKRVGGSPFCRAATTWTAQYAITSPDYLDVD